MLTSDDYGPRFTQKLAIFLTAASSSVASLPSDSLSDPTVDGSQERRRQRAIDQRLGFKWTRYGRVAVVNDRDANSYTFVANADSRWSIGWAGNQVFDGTPSFVAKGTPESLCSLLALSNLFELSGVVPQDRYAETDAAIANIRSRVIARGRNHLVYSVPSQATKGTPDCP